MIEEIKRQYQQGTVIALNWHEVRPTHDEPVVFEKSVLGHINDEKWQELTTPGTPLYNHWCAQVDVVAGYLAQLRDAHIPVLFRPYHEVNGNWFWWGYRPGPHGSAALYRQLYHRLVDVHHLDNLLWVWNVGAPGPATSAPDDYLPGDEYVDIFSLDNYRDFAQADYAGLLELAKGKPIALAEVGNVPTPQVLAQQPRWVYFMVWSGSLEKNPKGLAKEVFDLPQTLNRGDPRLAAPLEAIRKAAPGGGTPGTASLPH